MLSALRVRDRVFPSELMELFVFEWVIHGQAPYPRGLIRLRANRGLPVYVLSYSI